jgi:WhiB family redox-sensing transcriptional regulator
MESAPCRSADPDFWFDHQTVAAAKTICNTRCHLRAACLTYAIQNNEVHGVWGGMSAWQRAGLTEADLYGDSCDPVAA